MVMKALRQGASGGIIKFVLFGLMTLAVGGLVMMDVGGFFRGGGVRNTDVARAGNYTISLIEFDHKLRSALRQVGIGPQEAYKLGYIDQVLASEIRAHLVEQAARDFGITVGQQQVATKIQSLVAPMVQPGQSPAEVLKQLLQGQGMSEGELIQAIRRDMAGSALSDGLQSGFAATAVDMAKDLYMAQNEKRSIEYISFLNSELTDFPKPSDEDLKTIYEATKEEYGQQEMRTLKLIKIKDSELRKTLEITDEELRQAYNSNKSLYETPAVWILEQALLSKEEDARKTAEETQKNGDLKDAVKTATGKTADYLGSQSFEDNDLEQYIKQEVLAAGQAGAVIGPIKTPAGWQIVRIKDVKPAATKSFDEVKKDLRTELAETKLVDEMYALSATVDDMLAGGATLDEVAKEAAVTVTELPPINHFGQDAQGGNALKDYEQTGNAILETGFDLAEGETSPVMEMADGSFTAINATSIKPKTYASFEDVKDKLATRWTKDQQRVANKVVTEDHLSELKESGKSLQEFAQTYGKTYARRADIARAESPVAPFAPQSMSAIFKAPVGESFIADIEGGAAIVRVTASELPEKIDTSSETFKKLLGDLQNTAQNEALSVFLENKNSQYGTKVNQELLKSAYGGGAEDNASGGP